MSWMRAVIAVFCAFAGIRKGAASARDARLRPWQIVLGAALALICLIGLLLALALWASG